MDLRGYVDEIHRQLEVAAEAGGDEARALAERLVAPLDAAIRLALQDVLVAAAEEITCELAPGSVELRLRGRDPEFVVTPPPADVPGNDRGTMAVTGVAPAAAASASAASASAASASAASASGDAASGASASGDADEGALTRINLRMPDQLKARIEHAASGEGLSVNSWLLRAATAALERTDPGPRRLVGVAKSGQRFTGWAR